MNSPASEPGNMIIWNQDQHRWRRVLCAYGQVTTSATVGVRSPVVIVTNNYETVFLQGSSDSFAASQTTSISWAIGALSPNMAVGPGGHIAMSLPDIWLPPNWAMELGLANWQAGDVMSGAHVMLQEAYPPDVERLFDQRNGVPISTPGA